VAVIALLELARGRIGLDLELKEHGLQESLLAALGDWNGEFVVSSLLLDALQAVSDLDPTVTTGFSSSDRSTAIQRRPPTSAAPT
jgi:hypothetical protein